MKRVPRFVAVALGSALAASTLLLSPDVAPAGPRAHAGKRFQEHLGLSDQQMTVIRDIRARHADQRRETGAALERAQTELRDLALRSGDPAAIKAKGAEIAALMTQAIELRAAELQEIAPHLTREQLDKFANMSMRGKHHRGRAPSGQS